MTTESCKSPVFWLKIKIMIKLACFCLPSCLFILPRPRSLNSRHARAAGTFSLLLFLKTNLLLLGGGSGVRGA